MQHTLHTVSQCWRRDAAVLTDYFKCCYSSTRQADIHRHTVLVGAAAATSQWLMSQTVTHVGFRMLRHLVDGQNAVQGVVAGKCELC